MEENEKNVFGAFKFMDQTPAQAKSASKESKKVEDKPDEDDNLSEEDLKAIEDAANENANRAGKDPEDIQAEEREKADARAQKKTDAAAKQVADEEALAAQESQDSAKGEVENDNGIPSFVTYMHEKGILDVTDEDTIDSEEDLERIQSNTIQNGINSYKDSIPEDGRKFLDFIGDGGKPSDFHKAYYGEASFEGYEAKTEADQKYIISEALRLEEYTEEEIADELADIEDMGRLEKKSGTFLRKLQKAEAEQKKHILKAQKDSAKAQSDAENEEWKKFKSGLYEKEEIGGFKLNKKTKDDLWNYMTKVDKKTGKTNYQTESNENEDARYVFAYLLKNKWDITALERLVENKAVGKLRGKLGNYSDSRGKLKSGKKFKQEKQPDNPFANFSKARF